MTTRNKSLILSFILVFAMLIGVFTIMPMTASAAGGSESATTRSTNPIFNEVDIGFSIGGEKIADESSTDFKKRSGNGWELVVNRRENVTTTYYFDLYLDDYKGEGILFTIKNLNPTSTISNVIFNLYVSGECYVSGGIYINLCGEHLNEDYKTTGMPAGIIMTGTVTISFAPGSTLDVSSSLEIVNTAYLENIFNIVGSSDKEKPSSMSASCITHSRVNWNSNKTQTYINNGSIGIGGYHNLFLDGSVPTKVPPSSTLVGIMDYSAAKTVYSFAETTNLFFAGYSGSFADIKSMFVASSAGTKVVASAISLSHKTQIGNSKDGPFIALSDNGTDLLKVSANRNSIYEGAETAIRSIGARPEVADGLHYFGSLEDPNSTFYVKTSYEFTNIDTGEKVASATINGSLFFGTNFLERQDGTLFEEGSDKYTFELRNYVSSLTTGSYTFTYTSTLYLNGEVFEEETETFNVLITNEDGSVDGMIIDAKVNDESCVNDGIISVPMTSSSGKLIFSFTFKKPVALNYTVAPNYIGSNFFIKPTVSYIIDRDRWIEMDEGSYTLTDNGDGTYTITVSSNTGYVGMRMQVRVFLDIVNPAATWDITRLASYTIGAQVVGKYINIDSANITVPEPVEGLTPANVKGTLNTEGLTINKETWYELNTGSGYRPMSESDVFVAGKQYKYEAFVASTAGYQLASDFYLKINGSFASGNGGLWKMKSPVTARTILSAEAVNNTLTVEHGGKVTLAVNARGDGLTYVWRNTGSQLGAPSIGTNGKDSTTLTCSNSGSFYYTCTVSDKYGNQKVIEFIVMVKAKVTTPKDVYTPARPIAIGSGIEGIEDLNNIIVTKGSSITLKATYKCSTDPKEPYHGGKTPVSGTISYEWVLYILDGSGLKTVVLSTTDTLVIDGNLHETYNTNNLCEIMILLNIVNTATIGGEELTQSNLSGCTVYVVEGEETGDVGGKIGQSTQKARSGNTSLEGTTVYLVKDSVCVFATDADASGNYLFTGVPYGQYTIKVDKEGYDEYNEPINVSSASVEHDITIIVHRCFREEGMTMHFPASEAYCDAYTDGILGNIEYRGCIACGKFYDMEGNLIADSANDPGSLNDMGVPYKAIIYPVHLYYGQEQEGGNADMYLRHRAETCLEETTYWYYCINPSCRKSAGDDPMAVDMYYVGSASNQTHSYTLEIADDYYFYQGGTSCTSKKWYYHACEYCYEKGNTVWESSYYGAHAYGTKIPAQSEVHTKTELKAGVAAHYICKTCNGYFDEAYIETTLPMLTGAVPTHSYTNINGYRGADGHANTCECGAYDAITLTAHTSSGAATENKDEVCVSCGFVITPALGHTHNYATQKHDENNHWAECSCGAKKDVTAHAGGIATCKDKAKCSNCNTTYGALAEHKYSTATCTAKAKCSVCGVEKGELAAHSYVAGKCECGATDPNYTTETTKSAETTKPVETTKPEETTAPAETTTTEATAAPEVTAAPETTVAPEATNAPATDKADESKGCGGFVAVPVAIIAILGTALIVKKKIGE